MTKPQIGGSEFNAEIARIRNAANAISDSIDKILDGAGPQTTAQLIAKIAVQIGILLNAATNIERIGREARNERNKPGQN